VSEHNEFKLFIDGASRGNPGPAAYGFVIYHKGEKIKEQSGFLGEATNNVAEYSALLEGLKSLKNMKAEKVVVYSDSQLVVRQIKGEYKVRDSKLKPLYKMCLDLLKEFTFVNILHIEREKNKEADRLANKVLDEVQRRLGSRWHLPEESPGPTGQGAG